VSSWHDRTDAECALREHLHRDDDVCLGLIVRYRDGGRRTPGGAPPSAAPRASVRARATRRRAPRSSARSSREVGSGRSRARAAGSISMLCPQCPLRA
jgi:hypothetical protein